MDELFWPETKKSELVNSWINVKMREWHYAKI